MATETTLFAFLQGQEDIGMLMMLFSVVKDIWVSGGLQQPLPTLMEHQPGCDGWKIAINTYTEVQDIQIQLPTVFDV